MAPDPAGSTYELVDRAGTVIVTGTVTVVDDVAQVALDASDLPATLALGVGYAEHWGLKLGGVVRAAQRQVVMARFELHPPVSQQDLLDEYPDLLADLVGFTDTLQPYMDLSWGDVTRAIVRRGDFPDVICEPSDIYEWYREVTFERIFRSLAKSQPSNERWKELWTHHLAARDQAAGAVRFLPDRDRNGVADQQAREPMAKSYHPNVPPRRYPRRDPRW